MKITNVGQIMQRNYFSVDKGSEQDRDQQIRTYVIMGKNTRNAYL